MRQSDEWANLEIVLISDETAELSPTARTLSEARLLQTVSVNFRDRAQLARAIQPYKQSIAGVTCRGDRHVQYMRYLVDVLPSAVRVPTKKALHTATNKRLMREAMRLSAPELTPRYVQVKDGSPASVALIERRLGYPVIVKPASLASSLLIKACNSRAELATTLNHIFSVIDHVYSQEGRHDQPEVVVEEFLEGSFYSVYAYVGGLDEIYYCPPVRYVTAKQRSIDDFHIYKRSLPAGLDDKTVAEAYQAAGAAITAVGLTYSTAHVELVKSPSGWKIIELGPRVGRFRIKMYGLSYGIDHSLNDIKIRLGVQPDITCKSRQFTAAYSIYPNKEGTLRQIKNLQTVVSSPLCAWYKIWRQPGQPCQYACHGGHALAEFIITSDNYKSFGQQVAFIEKNVVAEVD